MAWATFTAPIRPGTPPNASNASGWGIAAFTGRRPDAAEALPPQDGLYTLITRSAEGDAFAKGATPHADRRRTVSPGPVVYSKVREVTGVVVDVVDETQLAVGLDCDRFPTGLGSGDRAAGVELTHKDSALFVAEALRLAKPSVTLVSVNFSLWPVLLGAT